MGTQTDVSQFWSMTEDGRLIRPIAIRPTHALPPINIASSSTDKSGNKRRGLPPKRTRIRVINPSTWHPSHHSESDLPAEETELARDDEWIFESDEEEEEDEEGRILVGRWVQRGGVDDHLQEVWISGKIAQGALPVEAESEDGAVSDVLVEPAARDGSTSPLFASRRISRSPSPLFPNRPADVASQRDHGSSSPLFPGRTADEPSSRGPPSPLFPGRAAAFEDESDTGEMESLAAESPASAPEATPTSNKRSTSPLFASRKPSALPTPSVSAPTLPVTAAKPDAQVASSEETASNPFYEVAKAERSRDLGFLAAFLGEDVTADNKPTKGEWAGFDEDDDDDLEDIAPLRIRGGKADFDDDDSEEDEDMSDSSSSDSSDDSDSESESGGEARNTSAAKLDTNGAVKLQAAAPVVTASAKPQSALKAMFAPAPAQSSFSLLGALDADIELDEELDIPLAPPVIRQPLEPVAELQPLTQSKKSHFDPDPSIPLFFPSFGKGGKDAMREDTEREDYQGFWRQETDEEMKEIWERDKVELTRDWKKRYREGKKQKKRRGGANDVE